MIMMPRETGGNDGAPSDNNGQGLKIYTFSFVIPAQLEGLS
jgi:hypothetical protein